MGPGRHVERAGRRLGHRGVRRRGGCGRGTTPLTAKEQNTPPRGDGGDAAGWRALRTLKAWKDRQRAPVAATIAATGGAAEAPPERTGALACSVASWLFNR